MFEYINRLVIITIFMWKSISLAFQNVSGGVNVTIYIKKLRFWEDKNCPHVLGVFKR